MIIYAKLNSDNYIVGYQYNEPSDLTNFVIINTTIKPTIHKHKFINNKLVECDYSSEYKVRLEAIKKVS